MSAMTKSDQSVRSLRKRRHKQRRKYIAILAAAAAAGMFLWWQGRSGSGAAGLPEGSGTLPDSTDRIVPVKRGDFNITILIDGTLEAIKNNLLKMEARRRQWNIEVSYIVEDNSEVKKDDVVMQFEPAQYLERVDEREVSLEENARDLALKTDELTMKRSSNIFNIKTAADNLWKAEDALEKYVDLEAPKSRRDLVQAITDAQAVVDTAETELDDAETKLSEAKAKGDNTASAETAVTSKKKALKDAEVKLETANHNYRVWKQYDYPQKMRDLESSVEREKLNLRQVTAKAESEIFSSERNISQLRDRRRRLIREREELIEDIKNLTITAPTAGVVTLGDNSRRRWGGQPKEWKIGTTAGTGETVASIPDLSSYKVLCNIPEEQRSKARIGLRATFRSTAIPNLLMTGRLASISPISTNIDMWDQNSPKVYASEIIADTVDSRLKPGMTVKVEIVVETVENALYVPVEAVYRRNDKKYVSVRANPLLSGAESREVEVGRNSFDYVEILSGLEEGDEIMVANPEVTT